MKILKTHLDSPELELACDEALLERCDGPGSEEVLRFWQPKTYFIVLGYSNAWKEEVFASGKGPHFPVLRRSSGGGTVLQGPGCLNYSLVLRVRPGPLSGILSTNRFVMERNRSALERLLGKPVGIQGSTDLTLGDLKFSGNSQRRKKNALLFHGTFLLDLDLTQIERGLRFPPKRPAYRRDRPHSDFLVNLGVPPAKIMHSLADAWNASGEAKAPDRGELEKIAGEKFGNSEWNLRR